jgi:hypothetical protein
MQQTPEGKAFHGPPGLLKMKFTARITSLKLTVVLPSQSPRHNMSVNQQ